MVSIPAAVAYPLSSGRILGPWRLLELSFTIVPIWCILLTYISRRLRSAPMNATFLEFMMGKWVADFFDACNFSFWTRSVLSRLG